MYFFVGLGNPGDQYVRTRHNVGWLFLDYWQREYDFPSFQAQPKFKAEVSKVDDNFLIKPQTFMNNSGEAARAVIQYFDKEALNHQPLVINHLFVIHDDLDIPFGKFKIQFGTGPKVHNGINSVRQHLKTDQFWYIRIGVDNRNGNRVLPGHAYVLQPFSVDEQLIVDQMFQDIDLRLQQELKIV